MLGQWWRRWRRLIAARQLGRQLAEAERLLLLLLPGLNRRWRRSGLSRCRGQRLAKNEHILLAVARGCLGSGMNAGRAPWSFIKHPYREIICNLFICNLIIFMVKKR